MTWNWIEPKYSKEKVKRAGESLIDILVDEKQFNDAIPILHNWRAAHAFPMQIILDLARKNAIRIDKNAVAVQRLKRVSSIHSKLARENSMSLSRMEDIAGCRIILSTTRQVYKVYEQLKCCKTKNILHRERDYIKSPKESGYRGIHLIYKYKGSKQLYLGMPVELQIRSKIQHSWATTVEVVGTFTRQALKASRGEAIWLEYFQCASNEFAKLEGYQPHILEIDTYKRLVDLNMALDVGNRLRAFNVAVNNLTKGRSTGVGYFVLLLKMDEHLIQITRYGSDELAKATEFYDAEESKYKNDNSKDLVMVSAKSLTDLKKAYPNYFSDTIEFTKNIQKINTLHEAQAT